MKRMITTLALAATMVLAMASVALADPDGPTCANAQFDADVENHGQHVIEKYVETDTHGGPAAGAHFGGGFRPGASFCIDAADSGVIYTNPAVNGRPQTS
jgi:hypothetical protein